VAGFEDEEDRALVAQHVDRGEVLVARIDDRGVATRAALAGRLFVGEAQVGDVLAVGVVQRDEVLVIVGVARQTAADDEAILADFGTGHVFAMPESGAAINREK
jgi:hypothetical protein